MSMSGALSATDCPLRAQHDATRTKVSSMLRCAGRSRQLHRFLISAGPPDPHVCTKPSLIWRIKQFDLTDSLSERSSRTES